MLGQVYFGTSEGGPKGKVAVGVAVGVAVEVEVAVAVGAEAGVPGRLSVASARWQAHATKSQTGIA
jgi:hypothetical protein